jgi:Tol biopolymer transport system component
MPIAGDSEVSAVSPDGIWTAYEVTQGGPTQIWIRNRLTAETRLLTGGDCNNTAPAWELNSKAVLFASDCSRAFGLPAIYRAELAGDKN